MDINKDIEIKGLEGNKYSDFFVWCHTIGLKTEKDIISNLPWSSPTLKTWMHKTPQNKKLPFYMELFCLGFEENMTSKKIDVNARVSFDWFDNWKKDSKINTFNDTGALFGISKQAVHHWYARGNLPVWLPFACSGLEIKQIK